MRVVPLFPELRQLLLRWKVRSPFTDPEDYVLVTGSRGPVQQRNAQRTLAKAKEAAGLDSLEGRLSWHSLRHSAGSVWLTEYGLPVTTVSAIMGHANPSFTLACYGRDPATPRRWSRTCWHGPRPPDTCLKPAYRSRRRESERRPSNEKARLAGLFVKPEDGFEPSTPCLQDRCSDQLSYSGLPRS